MYPFLFVVGRGPVFICHTRKPLAGSCMIFGLPYMIKAYTIQKRIGKDVKV